jgi:carbonic anhydrase
VKISYVPTSFSVENNGHTIEAIPADLHADSVVIDDTTYYLQQFHFHATSEHLINGASAAAELHLVNKSDDGEIVVLSLLIQPGAASAPLAEMFSALPPTVTEEGDEVELAQPIDLATMIPADLTSVRYDGSLTTPPCSEGVNWNVFLAPVTFSPEQLAALTALYPDNHRPTQPLHDREVSLVPAGS